MIQSLTVKTGLKDNKQILKGGLVCYLSVLLR